MTGDIFQALRASFAHGNHWRSVPVQDDEERMAVPACAFGHRMAQPPQATDKCTLVQNFTRDSSAPPGRRELCEGGLVQMCEGVVMQQVRHFGFH